jgi:outer membrane protein assembly factor BamA
MRASGCHAVRPTSCPARSAAGAAWSRAAASLLAFALSLAAPLFAQAPLDRLIGRPISGISLELEGRPITEVEISRVLETQVGSPFSTSEVRESIVHLMALSRFEDVRVAASESGGGVQLTYRLVPLRSIKGLAFRGNVGLSARQLRAQVTDRYGSSPPSARAPEIARALEVFYHDHGFLDASVTPHIEAAPGAAHATMVFDVAAGNRAVIGAADVEGAPGGATGPVVQRLGLQRGMPFDFAALRDRVASYIEELRTRGYFEAKVEIEPGYSEDRERVDVTVRMNRGPHVTLVFRGDPLPEGRKDELARIRREGSIDEDMLENEQRGLEDDLRAQGFRDAAVPYTREASGADEVEIVFTVKRGPQYRVARVEIAGNQALPRSVFQPMLRLAPGQWFVKSRLDTDVATIAERYRRDGFRLVKVQSNVSPEIGEQAALVVLLTVTEGPQTRIDSVDFEGNAAMDQAALRSEIRSRPGTAYYEPAVNADRDAVLVTYLNRGYQLANVDVRATFTPDSRGVALRVVIAEGPQIRVDHVLVVGNVRTKSATIEREIGLRRGMPLSLQQLAQGQGRLNALGLFRRVQVTELQHGSETERDVLVMVEEAPPNTIGYGAGLEGARRLKTDLATGRAVERLDFAPRGFVEYGRRNLWGKNRSINLFARAAIRTSDQVNAGSAESPLEDTTAGFREYRLLGTFREPKLFGTAVDLAFTAVTEQAIRSSFDFRRGQVILEASHRFGRTVSGAARYAIGRTRLFNERIAEEDLLNIDRVYRPGVRLSSISTSFARNTRDDAADPTRGTLLLLDGTLAARRLGSEVGFLKGTMQGFTYHSLPSLRGSVLAFGARVGLASGFAQITPEGQKLQDLPASERFFAGGDTTVRGFAQDRLGSAEVLDRNGVSNGGNALVVLNAELRIPLLQRLGLGGAAFADVGNVFARVNDLDLGKLRTGLGVGIRWRSPVGPLRVDFGWKASPRTFANGTRESRFAPYVSIGQAF